MVARATTAATEIGAWHFQLVQIFPILFLYSCANPIGISQALPGLLFMFAVPVFDLVVGRYDVPGERGLEDTVGECARSAPYIFSVLYLVSVSAGAFYVSRSSGLVSFFSCVFSVGVCAGIAFSAVHELVHRQTKWSLLLARLCLSFLCFVHFELEHLYSHHRFAATSKDTSTARLGESVYTFLWRSIPAGIVFAWRLERKRLNGKPGDLFRSPSVLMILLTIAIVVIFGAELGPRAVLFYLAQAVVGITLLMIVSYIQHYGLERLEEGERFSPRHAWDSNYRLSSWTNFGVQHHSSHHLRPRDPYSRRLTEQTSPELPGSYQLMIVLALVPPLWKRVINPRVPGVQNPDWVTHVV